MSKPDRNWLYMKLFLPQGEPTAAAMEGTVDLLLRDCLLPSLASARGAGLCEDYFFLRYAEAGYHLRIRCRCPAPGAADAMAAHLEASIDAMLHARRGLLGEARDSEDLKAGGMLRRDAYLPEYDKYCGEEGVRLAESHFGACSRLVESALGLHAQGLAKSQLSLWLMGQALASLPLDPAGMVTVMGGYATFWRKGCFPEGSDVEAILERNYAGKRAGIAQFLPQGPGRTDTVFAAAHPRVEEALGSVRGIFAATLARFCALEDAGRLDSSFAGHVEAGRSLDGHGSRLARNPMSYLLVLPNLLHMMNNRLGLDVLQESQLAYYLARAFCERHDIVETPFEIVLEPASLQAPEALPG